MIPHMNLENEMELTYPYLFVFSFLIIAGLFFSMPIFKCVENRDSNKTSQNIPLKSLRYFLASLFKKLIPVFLLSASCSVYAVENDSLKATCSSFVLQAYGFEYINTSTTAYEMPKKNGFKITLNFLDKNGYPAKKEFLCIKEGNYFIIKS